MGLVPKLISQLFTKINEYYDYNTLYLSVGRSGAIYRYSSFHGNNIWNFVKYMYPLMYHICVLKKLTLSYLIANDIVYGIKSYFFLFY